MYNQHRIYRVFQLISQLKAGPAKSPGSLAKMLGVTVRSVYRYLDLLEQSGFQVEKDAHGKFFLVNQGARLRIKRVWYRLVQRALRILHKWRTPWALWVPSLPRVLQAPQKSLPRCCSIRMG